MRDQITERLKALEAEAEAGQKMLAELDARRAALTTTLLRIEGAIQVLKELSNGAESDETVSAGPNGSSPGAKPA
jgi:prefoldin subunit 5